MRNDQKPHNIPLLSGQIIATSHALLGPPKGSFLGNGTPEISGKSRLVKYVIPLGQLLSNSPPLQSQETLGEEDLGIW